MHLYSVHIIGTFIRYISILVIGLIEWKKPPSLKSIYEDDNSWFGVKSLLIILVLYYFINHY